MRKFLSLLFLVLIFALAWTKSISAQIIINEIGAFEKTSSEWIEIYNNGSGATDISGWKFFENDTNHGLNAFQGDLIIEPGEYAIIAQEGNIFLSEKSFSGTIIDSSWSTLREDGEEIGLKDNSGLAIEQFVYLAAPDHSLERKNPGVNDNLSNNWKEHATGHTAGAQNSNFFSENNPAPTPTPSPENNSPNNPTPQSFHPSDIVINELIAL